MLFVHAGVARQVAANQLTIAERAQRRADHRCAQRHREIRYIFAAGEGDITPAGQPAKAFGPISRAGFMAKPVSGPMEAPITAISRPISSGASGPRGTPLPSSVSAVDDAHQDSGNHHLYREGLHKIDMRVRVSGEDASQIKAFHAAAYHMVGGFIIEEKIVIKPVN